jgi:replicative DNA helicase
LDNIRLKFLGQFGKFDNLDEFGITYNDSLPSKMNLDAQNPFATPNLPTPNDAFGSTMNSGFNEDSDVPF